MNQYSWNLLEPYFCSKSSHPNRCTNTQICYDVSLTVEKNIKHLFTIVTLALQHLSGFIIKLKCMQPTLHIFGFMAFVFSEKSTSPPPFRLNILNMTWERLFLHFYFFPHLLRWQNNRLFVIHKLFWMVNWAVSFEILIPNFIVCLPTVTEQNVISMIISRQNVFHCILVPILNCNHNALWNRLAICAENHPNDSNFKNFSDVAVTVCRFLSQQRLINFREILVFWYFKYIDLILLI